MAMISGRFLRRAALALLVLPTPQQADVVINEISANSSERLLRWDASGVPYLGTGPRWYQAAYTDSSWLTGVGPFGFGSVTGASSPVATNLQPAMLYLTPTAYFRKTFDVGEGDQARTDQVQLVIEYNDGFVAYVNGAEVARRNAGPAKKFIYHDQSAYNRETFTNTAPIPTATLSETINIGPATSALLTGSNVLAVHLLNASANDGTFYLKAGLQISGSPVTALVTFSEPWKYLPGVVEPSGNLYDPSQLNAARQNVLWGRLAYNDETWSTGAGPFGFGNVGTIQTNVQTAMLNVTPSLYTRIAFQASGAQAGDPQPLRLTVSCDDGFVAYLNGVEVARRRIGLPNTFTPRDAVADSNLSSPATETILLDAASRLLVPGTNVLAIQTHNFTANNTDLYIKADLLTSGATVLAANNATWNYFVGTAEPVLEVSSDEEESSPEGPDSAADWIELYNNGTAPVSLLNWSLTDDPAVKKMWTFPDMSIPAGGYLVVVADAVDLTDNPTGYLHTNFKLAGNGEFLGFYDQNGSPKMIFSPGYPAMSPFLSYVRGDDGLYRFSDVPTPGAPNAGAQVEATVAAPVANPPGRFYSGSRSVTLSCATPGATIRYETSASGVDVTAASPIYTAPLTFFVSTVLRARAYLADAVPSEMVTHTYLINQSTARQSLPAAVLSGDEQKVFYRPFGIFAIAGGGYWSGGTAPTGGTNTTGFNGVWHYFTGNSAPATTAVGQNPLYPVPNFPADRTAYNAPMQSGKPAERPVSFEILHTDATPDLRIGSFVRAAGSPYSRNRYVLTNQNSATPNSQSPWTSNSTQKPQLNLFFRDDVGPSPLIYPLIPNSPITRYDNIRLRAGKNDLTNPFIRDEFCRRLMNDMGQVSVLGDFCNLYINGSFKGYFNICQRARETYFQEARHTSAGFDVRNITVVVDGDTLAYNELMNFAKTRTSNASTPLSLPDYQALQQRMDVVNLADYVILNVEAAMADWPGNNYIMDRERSPNGRYRFSVWDGEGGFGGFSRNPAYKIFTDIYTSGYSGESVPLKALYSVLRFSPEWRMLFADRLQKHFFNGGALTDANLTAKFNLLATRIQPIMSEVGNGAVQNYLAQWLNGQGDPTRYTTGTVTNMPSRRTVLFNGFFDDVAGGGAFVPASFKEQGLWPNTSAPTLSQFGGTVAADYQLTIGNPNASGGTIYFTTDGSDPRAVGGAAVGNPYADAITISQATQVKARIRSASGEWSPLADAIFSVPQLPALMISEIMYHPANLGTTDGDQFEFVEIKNAGATAVSLTGMKLVMGTEYRFPTGTTLQPGAFAIVARNEPNFHVRYPGVPIVGVYDPESLANSSESVSLKDVAGNVISAVTYSDANPWPTAADGAGKSLVPINTSGVANSNDVASWRASTNVNGSPGADDPPAFGSWRQIYFTSSELNDDSISGPFADPDSDGYGNLWEFAHALNPRVKNGVTVLQTSFANDGAAGPFLTLQFRRNRTAAYLQYHVDTTSDLESWNLDQAVQVGAAIDNGDGSETVVFRDTSAPTQAGKRFIRLRVVAE